MCNGLQTWQSKHFKAISKILHDNDAIRKKLKYEFPGFFFWKQKLEFKKFQENQRECRISINLNVLLQFTVGMVLLKTVFSNKYITFSAKVASLFS